MMKPGIELEPAYRLMAIYKDYEDHCERLNMSYDAEYWHVKLLGAQNALEALTGEWPGALRFDDGKYIATTTTYQHMPEYDLSFASAWQLVGTDRIEYMANKPY